MEYISAINFWNILLNKSLTETWFLEQYVSLVFGIQYVNSNILTKCTTVLGSALHSANH